MRGGIVYSRGRSPHRFFPLARVCETGDFAVVFQDGAIADEPPAGAIPMAIRAMASGVPGQSFGGPNEGI
jgi:hypothetical protein